MNIRAKEVRKNCKGHLWKMRVTWLECVIKSMKFGLTLISSGAGAGAGAGGRVVPVRTVPPEPSLIQIRWVPSHRCVLHYALCVTTASAFSDAVRPSVCSNSRRATRPLLIVSQAAVTHSCVYKQTNKQSGSVPCSQCRHQSLSWTTRIHLASSNPVFLRCLLILSPSTPRYSRLSLYFRFSD